MFTAQQVYVDIPSIEQRLIQMQNWTTLFYMFILEKLSLLFMVFVLTLPRKKLNHSN